jgi:hypothetical protein
MIGTENQHQMREVRIRIAVKEVLTQLTPYKGMESIAL